MSAVCLSSLTPPFTTPTQTGWEGTGLGTKQQGIQEPIKGGEVRDKQNKYKVSSSEGVGGCDFNSFPGMFAVMQIDLAPAMFAVSLSFFFQP